MADGERRTRGKPNETDAFVGRRIRDRRLRLGMSQVHLAEGLGLTFQQVQKYEKGGNRVGAGRLYALAQVLDVPVTYFFDGAPPPAKVVSVPEALAARSTDPMSSSETQRLVRAYYGIKDERARARFLAVMRAISGMSDEAAED
jgi:transcriptional regulator with XRE-family HTH domain